MARPNARAVGNYIATPLEIAERAGRLIDLPATDRVAVCDPCAGTGAALVALLQAIPWANGASERILYGCEFEATRAKELRHVLHKAASRGRGYAAHGDSFRIGIARRHYGGVSVLLLNPPYDVERGGRTETRWVKRWYEAVAPGGVLVLLIPAASLPPVAAFLAEHFEDLFAYRFPEGIPDPYGRVILLAKRRAVPRAISSLAARIRSWGTSLQLLPEIPSAGPPVLRIDTHTQIVGLDGWEVAPLDLESVRAGYRPWRSVSKGGIVAPVVGPLPPEGIPALRRQVFETAMPLSEGHVATALGCNAYDGVKIEPNDARAGLPPVFVKATLRRPWIETGRRTNDEGDETGVEYVQKPFLQIAALDLRRGRYVRFPSSLERRSATDIDQMTAADFIHAYSKSLFEVLQTQCRPLYDPTNPSHVAAVPLPPLDRPLFEAQAHRMRAIVRLLDTYGAALCFGATGVGKSVITIATILAKRIPRALVICPPHLLDHWRSDVRKFTSSIDTMVIDGLDEAERFARGGSLERPLLGILAETTAKLAASWVGLGAHVPVTSIAPSEPVTPEIRAHRARFLQPSSVGMRCPRCNRLARMNARDLGRKRAFCDPLRRKDDDQEPPLLPSTPLARIAHRLAWALAPVLPDSSEVRWVVDEHQPHHRRLLNRWSRLESPPLKARWAALRAGAELRTVTLLLARFIADHDLPAYGPIAGSLVRLLAALHDESLIVEAARVLWSSVLHKDVKETEIKRALTQELLLLLPPGSVDQANAAIALYLADEERDPYRWYRFAEGVRELLGAFVFTRNHSMITWKEGVHCFDGHPLGRLHHAQAALHALVNSGRFVRADPCRERLCQVTPSPRRVALAPYLAKRYRHRIGLVVIDEIHEASSGDSAHGQAMEQFRGRPMLGLTASFGNGYASSYFHTFTVMSAPFRAEFERGDLREFERRCGFLRCLDQDVDKDTNEVVVYGTQSDRVERRRRQLAHAPGVVPSFVMKHVLRIAVVLQMADLGLELPYREEVHLLDPLPTQADHYLGFRATLMDQIRRDKRTKKRGALFGAMSEEWSAPTLCAGRVGNSARGVYEARYPEAYGGGLVAEIPPFPPATLLPAENRLLEICDRALEADRNTLIFTWHTDHGLQGRIAGLVENHTGKRCPILTRSVKPRDRDSWLRKTIVGKERFLVVNPACVETGLNALTWFTRVIWFELPGCAARIPIQANGRVHRIGQMHDVIVYWLLYRATTQEFLRRLLMLKVAEIQSVTGADNTAALMAAGVGAESTMTSYDLGRLVYRALRQSQGENPDE